MRFIKFLGTPGLILVGFCVVFLLALSINSYSVFGNPPSSGTAWVYGTIEIAPIGSPASNTVDVVSTGGDIKVLKVERFNASTRKWEEVDYTHTSQPAASVILTIEPALPVGTKIRVKYKYTGNPPDVSLVC